MRVKNGFVGAYTQVSVDLRMLSGRFSPLGTTTWSPLLLLAALVIAVTPAAQAQPRFDVGHSSPRSRNNSFSAGSPSRAANDWIASAMPSTTDPRRDAVKDVVIEGAQPPAAD